MGIHYTSGAMVSMVTHSECAKRNHLKVVSTTVIYPLAAFGLWRSVVACLQLWCSFVSGAQGQITKKNVHRICTRQ